MSSSSKLGKSLSNLDQFGVLSQISFLNNDPKYKTIHGGVLSLLIYSLGFCYFVFLMVMWSSSQIQPNVTIQQQFNPGLRNFELSQSPFVFSLEVENLADEADPIFLLQSKGNIFDHEIINENDPFTVLNQSDSESGCYGNKALYDLFDQICTNMDDDNQIQLQSDATNRTKDTYIKINIGHCDQALDSTCLSFEDQQSVFDKGAYWRLTLITQEYDQITQEIINIPQDYYFDAFTYQNSSTYNIQLAITQATYIIDTGILFKNEKIIQLTSSISLTSNSIQSFDPITNNPLIASINYSLSKNEVIVRITYPKLSTILAQFWSILQLLLLFGLILNMFNNALMQIKIEEALLKIYFPQMRLFQFRYNWRGKMASISTEGEIMKQSEFEQVKKFRKTSANKVRSKLNYMSILQNICRIQIQMQMWLPREQFVKLQDLGYQMDSQTRKSSKDLILSQENELLDYEDFLLSLNQDVLGTSRIQIQNEQLIIQNESQGVDMDEKDLDEKDMRQMKPQDNE